MVTSSVHAKSEVQMCFYHEGQHLEIYCNKCKRTGCIICARNDHHACDWETLDKNARKRRVRLPSTCSRFRNEGVRQIQECIDEACNLKSKNARMCCDFIENIKSQKARIVAVLDRFVDQLVSKYETLRRETTEFLDNIVISLEEQMKMVSEMIDTLEENRFHYTNTALIELDDKIQQEIDQIIKTDFKSATEIPSYTEGEVNICVLEGLLGYIRSDEKYFTAIPRISYKRDISQVAVTELSSFTTRDKMVTVIQPVNDSQAWIHSFGTSRNKLIDKKGSELRTLKLGYQFDDCDVLKTGNLVLSTVNGIKHYDLETGLSRVLIQTAPLSPIAVCRSHSGGLLVSVVDVADYLINEESQRFIRHYSMKGKVLRNYHEDHDGKPLFTLPYRVKQNFNGNVCVIDRMDESKGSLVVLHEDGRFRYRYKGQNLDRDLDPFDLSCDENCNIIISDVHNHALHLISPTGQFLKFLFIQENGFQFPISLALGYGILWIGCWKGKVHAFEYSLE